MAVLKKHLTPLRKRGQINKFAGKGSSEQPLLPSRNVVKQLASDPYASPNDYAKATPGIGQPTPGIFGGVDPDGDGDFHG